MNSMQFENRGDYLYFKFSREPVDVERARILQSRVIAETAKAGIPKVLFELAESEQLL